MNGKPANRAFTLLEMLISLAIVAVIVTMVYGSYAATSRTIDLHSRRKACSERAQLVLRMMARQIRCAYLPTSEPDRRDERSASPEANTADRKSTIRFQGDGRKATGEILSFTTTGGFSVNLNRPAGLSTVMYRYDSVGRRLSLSCRPQGPTPADMTDHQRWPAVLEGLAGIRLAFHDGSRWQPQWDSRMGRGLPRAVRIALTLIDESGREHACETTVPIACRTAATHRQRKQSKVP